MNQPNWPLLLQYIPNVSCILTQADQTSNTWHPLCCKKILFKLELYYFKVLPANDYSYIPYPHSLIISYLAEFQSYEFVLPFSIKIKLSSIFPWALVPFQVYINFQGFLGVFPNFRGNVFQNNAQQPFLLPNEFSEKHLGRFLHLKGMNPSIHFSETETVHQISTMKSCLDICVCCRNGIKEWFT